MKYYFTWIYRALATFVAVTTLGIATVTAYAADNLPEVLPDLIVVQ